jgi:LysR family nitrogen assimilation transcriptional regulator
MTLRQLRYFVEIARSRSLTQAAQTLNIAQPALSTHIAALESELGVRLFERHAKGMQLSEAGERLCRRAMELLSGFDALRRDVNQAEDTPVGKVRLCIGGAIAGIVAGPLLRVVSERFPQIELSVTDGLSSDIQGLLETRAADLAMMPSAAEIPGMHTESVLEEQFMLFGAAQLMKDKPEVIALRDLAELPLVAPDRAHDARKIIERTAANAGFSLQVRYELNSTSMLLGVVKEGLAYAILPTSMCEDAIASGALARRPVDSPLLARIQAIVWLDERPLSPAAAAVKDVLARTVNDLVGRGLLEGRAV